MRVIVYGTGAIGGTIAAALARSGTDIIGIARGAHLAAIRQNGLLFHTPSGSEPVRFACVGAPAEIAFAETDIILLTMKAQHTEAALHDLRAAGVTGQAIFCAQNGVANERMAARYFPDVCGITVMMPASYEIPGEVAAFGAPKHGILDIGRVPQGTGPAVQRLCGMLNAANIAAFPNERVMRSKYGKLLLNLGNIIGPAVGRDRAKAWQQRVRAEAEQVLAAAGIEWDDVGENDPRRTALMKDTPINGVSRIGSSSQQSLARGAGSIETDYLNGEIALLGRLNGVPAPVNAAFCAIAQRLLSGALAEGAIADDVIEQMVADRR